MKKLLILLITSCPLAFAQQAPASISQQLRSFLPMAQIYLKHLGLADRNGNGVIEKGASEGYEAFTAKYGNADVGFHANGIVIGADNGKLEEPEIINRYYINIRFKPDFQQETDAIESEVGAFIYKNNLPLVWMDDRYGSVMKVVNNILGDGWQDIPVTLDEAEERFTKVLDTLHISPLPGAPVATGLGYRTLPDFVRTREGYCFEVAQFYFWLFSKSKIRSINMGAVLAPHLAHGVIILTDNKRIIDYFGTSNIYSVPAYRWEVSNPLQDISDYYFAQARTGKTNNITDYYEQAAVYNKYDIAAVGFLMERYAGSSMPNYQEIIALGEFIINNMDFPRVIYSNSLDLPSIKNNITIILLRLIECYSKTRNHAEFEKIKNILNRYFANDPRAKEYLNYYRF